MFRFQKQMGNMINTSDNSFIHNANMKTPLGIFQDQNPISYATPAAQSSQNKLVYRPLTAHLQQNPKEENQTASSLEKKLDESSIISGRVDLSMVVKSSQTKYSRADFLRLKQRIESNSPQKQNQASQQYLEPMFNTANTQQNQRDSIKRVSFKEQQPLDQEARKSIHHQLYTYQNQPKEVEITNTTGKRNFEYTFDPKKDAVSQSQNLYQTQKQTFQPSLQYGEAMPQRPQSVLQGYQEQIISRKNKQFLSDVQSEKVQEQKPSLFRTNFANLVHQNLQEGQKKSHQSILKHSTLDAHQHDLLSKAASKKLNNQTLNESLRFKIHNEDLLSKEESKKDLETHTQFSRERSLEKSGIDFINEAKDFSNIISNLKNLLNKDKTSITQKSFQTLDHRPISHIASTSSNLVSQSHTISVNPVYHNNSINPVHHNISTLTNHH